MHPLQIFIILLMFPSLGSCFIHPWTLVAPIIKHINTSSLYSMTLNDNEYYLIDLDAPFTWFHCNLQHPLVGCTAPECVAARSYLSPLCLPANNTQRYGQCYCNDTPINPIIQKCALSQLTYKNFIIYWTNGRFPTVGINFNHLYTSCAPSWLLESFPEKIIGVASLSWSSLSLAVRFTTPEMMTRKFALCLPSSGRASGAIFFGDGPYYMLPTTNFDAASVLSYTPLLKNPYTLGYFINLSAILINGKASTIPETAFTVDPLSGHGGVKLSTIVPYTTLKSDIYSIFLKDFRKATKGIPNAKKVSPFGLCLKTRSIGITRVGLQVPHIDLQLGNGTKWMIYGSNSLKQISPNTACLAFVDGGKDAEQAVVIGTYQMENNFLLFDLVQSRFGFSSSLFSCSPMEPHAETSILLLAGWLDHLNFSM